MSPPTDATDDRLRRELLGIGSFTTGLLVLASLILSAQGPSGYLPAATGHALRVLVGSGSYVVALACLALGAIAILGNPKAVSARLMSALGLFFGCFLLALHAGIPEGAEFETEALTGGGGIVGAVLWWSCRHVLGGVCTWIVVAAALLVAAVLFTQAAARQGGRPILAEALLGAGRWLRGRTLPRVALRRPQEPPAASATQAPAAPRRRRVIDLSGSPPKQGELPLAQAEEPVSDAESVPLRERTDLEPQPGPTTTNIRASARRSRRARREEAKPYVPPPLALISRIADDVETREAREEAEANIARLEDTLDAFGIQAKVRHYVRGPSVTRYEVEPVRGIRVSRIQNLADDLAVAFGAIDVRVEAPIPGKSLIGIEVPNREVAVVGLRSILESEANQASESLLTVGVGKDIAGAAVIADLARMPHLLIAGATNSGKTVCLHSLITSLLLRARPDEVKLILIDPKRVELMIYDGIPHLMAPVVQTAAQAADVLRKVIREMERRFDVFAAKGVVNIAEYNELADMPKEDEWDEFDRLPYVVVIIDELADLMMQAKAEFEFSICRLAQLARATGIHLVIATQRPSVNVITGTIKANIVSRIALTVASHHDSRTIIDGQGADRLIGCGDMLYAPFDESKPRRVQGAYVRKADLLAVVDYLRDQGEPEYDIIPEVNDDLASYADEAQPSDELFEAAVSLVASNQEASVSMLQRRFKIGYARAGRLIDMMEERGIVGPSEGSKARKVLVGPGYCWSQHATDSYAHQADDFDGLDAEELSADGEEEATVISGGDEEEA